MDVVHPQYRSETLELCGGKMSIFPADLPFSGFCAGGSHHAPFPLLTESPKTTRTTCNAIVPLVHLVHETGFVPKALLALLFASPVRWAAMKANTQEAITPYPLTNWNLTGGPGNPFSVEGTPSQVPGQSVGGKYNVFCGFIYRAWVGWLVGLGFRPGTSPCREHCVAPVLHAFRNASKIARIIISHSWGSPCCSKRPR